MKLLPEEMLTRKAADFPPGYDRRQDPSSGRRSFLGFFWPQEAQALAHSSQSPSFDL